MQKPGDSVPASVPASPAGIDIRPEPPSAARVSKRAMVAGAALGVFLLGTLTYGMYAARSRNDRKAREREAQQVILPASADDLIRPVSPTPPPAVEEALQPLQFPDRQIQQQPLPQMIVQQPLPLPAAPKAPTPEEIEAQREREAMLSPLFPARDERRADGTAPPWQQATVERPSGGGQNPAAGTDSRTEDEYSLVNMQQNKKAFLDTARDKAAAANYLQAVRTPQIGICEIKAGWEIPAMLEQAVNSDLPGEIKALVSTNVYDTATGKYLLIPQGARLTGAYNSNVGYGQERAQVIWNRIIYPDGSSINLNGMMGLDQQGMAGFKDKVDRHYKRTFGLAALTSAFVVAYELTNRRQYGQGGYYVPSAGDRAMGAGMGEMSNTAAAVTRRNLSVQPTLKIAAGYRFVVRVNKDILFDSPYTEMPAEQEKPARRTLRTSR